LEKKSNLYSVLFRGVVEMNVDNKTPDKEYDSSLNNMFTTVLKQSIDNAAVGEVRGSEVNELLKGMYFQNKMSKRDIGESR
jgi:hypothetical protein